MCKADSGVNDACGARFIYEDDAMVSDFSLPQQKNAKYQLEYVIKGNKAILELK